MFKFIKKLFGRKPSDVPVIDRMIETFGELTVSNDVGYTGNRYGKDANDDDLPEEVKHEKYFKIKIGKLMSGYGDWGGGFDHVYKSFVEIHINCYSKILNVCAGKPFYNSSETMQKASVIAKKLVDELNAQLENSDDKRVVTNNWWLRGVLDFIHGVCWANGADLWDHRIEIRERIR